MRSAFSARVMPERYYLRTMTENEGSRVLGDWIPESLSGRPALCDPDAILDRFLSWVGATGIEPYPAQEEALLEVMAGNHVVLSTPTGSGKSLVALALHFKALCEGRRSFYTAPVKALASEKFFALCEHFGPENVGMLTGDASINPDAPVICCTAEVLANLALRRGEGADAPYVVMDEFHYYADPERGAAWQLPLLVLEHTRFLLMSATLGNTAAIEERIAERSGIPVAHVHSEERPVPLDFSYSEKPLHETLDALLAQDLAPVYMVCFTQRDAAVQAQALTSAKVSTREERAAIAEAIGDFRFDSPYGRDVQRILRHGIGLHHAGLLPRYRLLVEQLAQRGLLKVICGTDTLGVGVNVPIRTVLFTKLAKYDGEKTALLRVRDFRQIAGRAGRRGFDTRGSVVCQAPPHVVENLRAERKAAAQPTGGRRKAVKKKPPKGFVPWNAETFQKLIHSPTETLESRFRVGHSLVIDCLQRAEQEGDPSGQHGYRLVLQLIARSHEDARSRRRLRRDAAQLFRSLRGAEILRVERGRDGGRIRVDETLQRDFSLHQTLSLYLVEAIAALDSDAPGFALDVLSFVEAILEDPRAILYQLERRQRDEVMAEMKAQRVPYEERMERLERVSWPKPNAELIHATFEIFAQRHPWVGRESIRPKGIAREMVEHFSSFDDYVRRNQLARMEGLLLRYLGQVLKTLSHSVPAAAKNEEIDEITGYLRATIAHVDSSLVQEWETLVSPPAKGAAETAGLPPAREPEILRSPRAFRARVRAECQLLVRALAMRDYEQASRCIRQGAPGSDDDTWDAAALEAALAPFYAEYEQVRFDPPARAADLTLVKERASRYWDVHQTLVDERDERLWHIEAEVDLRDGVPDEGPLLHLRQIGT